MNLSSRERFVRTLTGQEVDRVPFLKVFGHPALRLWEQQQPGLTQRIDRELGFEGVGRGWGATAVNVSTSRLGPPKVLKDDIGITIRKKGDGTIEQIVKAQDYHTQILEYPVKDRNDWARIKDRHLRVDDPERFPPDWPAAVETYRRRDYPLQLTHGGVYGFARTMMGDEALAYAFYDDPALVREIMDSYTDMVIAVWERMTAHVDFDLIECWEDMAFNQGALISPALFNEFMKPNYLKLKTFAQAHKIPIILVDSDGYIEELAESMLAAGVTAMYPFEAQAGNDVRRVRERYPALGVIGGLNKNVMARDRQAMDEEIEKARVWIRRGRYIPGPDHGVLSDVTWENYRYFMTKIKAVILESKPGG